MFYSLRDDGDRLGLHSFPTRRSSDLAGAFVWKHLSALLCYSANRVPEIADDIVTIDRAMKWGYNRSEEHTSELQTPDHLVCRLLPEKQNIIHSSIPLVNAIMTATEMS